MKKRMMYYREALFREIQGFLNQGIEVTVDGEEYDEYDTPSEIDMILENAPYMTYMKSYTEDADGKIRAVEFNVVNMRRSR